MASEHSERLIQNSFLSFFNNAMGMILGFGVSILTARMLGPEKYGIYNIILWLMSVVSIVIGMGLNFTITKFVSEYQGKKDNYSIGQIIRFILWIELSLAVITFIFMMMYRAHITDYFFNPIYTLAFTINIVGLVPGIMTAVYASALEGIQKFRYFLIYSAIVSPVSLIIKIIILLNQQGIEALLLTNLVFSLINTAFYRWTLYHEKVPVGIIGKPPIGEVRNKIIRYNFSISTIMLLDKIIWDKSENFFLGKYCTAAQAGYFNMAYGLSNKFTKLISNTFWKVLFPFMSERHGADDQVRLKRVFYISTRYLAFFSFPIAAGGIVLSFPLIKYFLGTDYFPAQRALQIFFFSSIFGMLAIPQASVLYATAKQGFIIKYGAVLATLNLLLDFIFIPTYGATGAASINGIIRIFGYLGGIIYTMKITDITLPIKSLFKILYSAVLMAVLMQVVLKVNTELLGFILSIPVGVVVYLGSAFFVGTFELEDLQVFQKFNRYMPPLIRKPIDNLIRYIETDKISQKEKGKLKW